MKSSRYLSLFSSLCLIAPAETSTAEVLRYFPATPQNTTLADGSSLKTADKPGDSPAEITRGKGDASPNNHWHWQEAFGSGQGDSCGTFLASGKSGNDCPILRTTLTGLKPGSIHEVYGFFWVAGYADDKAVPAGDAQWDVRFGLGLADLLSYSHRNNSGFSGTIGPGNRYREVVRQCDQPIQPVAAPLVDRLADKRLFRAKLGTAAADADGTLIVNIDDRPDDSDQAPTCYDGIGVIEAAGAKTEIGVGAAGALHLAVRAGDWEMARRELAAKVDPNTLDKDGLTPLFYAAAYDDREHVNWLLKAGAKPDVERQAHTPLWAAATSGDVELAKTLLAAGAEVPQRLVDPATLAACYRSPSHLHPAVAAIRSGSVEVLKLLLAKQPKIDLDALFDSGVQQGPHRNDGVPLPLAFYTDRIACHAVGDAVQYRHPEMAEFLIRHGCRVNGNGTGESKGLESDDIPCVLLISAIQAHPAMTGVVNALIDKGWPMVEQQLPRIHWVGVVPWDGLSGAVAAGETELARRLSSGRNDLSPEYLERLLILAEASNEPETLNFVRQLAHGIKLDPKKSKKTREAANHHDAEAGDEAQLQMLIPRDHPPAKARVLEGDRVLAVICDSKTEGQGTALAVEASKQKGWKVVERGEIDSLLREQEFSNPWSGGKLSALGDRLSADVLILVSMLGEGETAVMRFEAVDVYTGLALLRQHVAAKAFKPADFSRDILTEIRTRIQERLEGKGLTAVTLLGLTANDQIPGQRALERALHSGMLGIIDTTPGMISLTRDQMRSIAEEKTFQKSDQLWNAAWTIEGGISPTPSGGLELGLRLRSLRADGKSHDAKATGAPEELPRMIRDAWTALLKEAGSGASPKVRDAEAVSAEAARLLREAEWLMALNDHHFHEAARLLESALVLGADPVKTVNYLIYARFQTSKMVTEELIVRRFFINPSNPRTVADAEIAAASLDEMLDLMRFAHQSLIKYEAIYASRYDSHKTIGELAKYLITYRCGLCPTRMNHSQLALFKQFDTELDDFVRLNATTFQKEHLSDNWKLVDFYKYLNDRNYDSVPALQDIAAEWFANYRTSHSRDNFFLQQETGLLTLPVATNPAQVAQVESAMAVREPACRISKSELLCRRLEHIMNDRTIPNEPIRRAEIAFLRSSGANRAVAARTLIQARMAANASPASCFYDWIPPCELERWVPMILLGDNLNHEHSAPYNITPPKIIRTLDVYTPIHGRILLPNLVHHPRPSPDLMLRQDGYHEFHGKLASRFIFHHGETVACSEDMVNLIRYSMHDGAPTEKTKDRLEGAELLGMIYGSDIRGDIEKILEPILNPHAGPLVAATAVDLRDQSMANKAAMMTCPVVDPDNRNLLWMRLQSVQGWRVPLSSMGGDYSVVDHPWLIALDCANRNYAHRLDLAKSPGLWPQGGTAATNYGNVISDYNHVIVGKSSILLSIDWGNPNRKKGPASKQEILNMSAVVLIDRKTGKLTEVPGLPTGIQYGHGGSGDLILLATPVGDDFFAFASPGIREYFDDDRFPACLWQIKPDGTVKMLTKPGRRPELSPFDAMDRKDIDTLRNDGSRLLVSCGHDYYHYYDPQKETWQVAPPSYDFSQHVNDLGRADFNSFIFPAHILQMNDGGADVYFSAQNTKAGSLVFERKSGSMRELPVVCKIPETYTATFGLRGKLHDKPLEEVPLKELKPHTIILHQTSDHLVLGLSFGGTRHGYQTRVVNCLPFVWLVEKEKVREAIRKIEQAGK